MKTVKNINKEELIDMLLNWNHGAQPASVQYLTSPKLTKEGKILFGAVSKFANIGIMLGYNYQNSVNYQRERENEMKNFMAQPLWNGKGKRLSTALSTHIEKGTFYMSYKAQQTFRAFHFDCALNFIPYEMIKPFFPKKKNYSQGTNKPINHREISIENIKKLKFKNVTYIIS